MALLPALHRPLRGLCARRGTLRSLSTAAHLAYSRDSRFISVADGSFRLPPSPAKRADSNTHRPAFRFRAGVLSCAQSSGAAQCLGQERPRKPAGLHFLDSGEHRRSPDRRSRRRGSHGGSARVGWLRRTAGVRSIGDYQSCAAATDNAAPAPPQVRSLDTVNEFLCSGGVLAKPSDW